MAKREPLGYMVIWWDNDKVFCLPQTLVREEHAPDHGILSSLNGDGSGVKEIAIFRSADQGREAIRQLRHFNELHYPGLEEDDTKQMVVVPVHYAPTIAVKKRKERKKT